MTQVVQLFIVVFSVLIISSILLQAYSAELVLLLWYCGCLQYSSLSVADICGRGRLLAAGLLQARGLNMRCSWLLCRARDPALLQGTMWAAAVSTGWQVCRRSSKLWFSLARCICGAESLVFLSHFEKPALPHPQLIVHLLRRVMQEEELHSELIHLILAHFHPWGPAALFVQHSGV